MQAFVDLLIQSLGNVWTTLLHNWPFLLASIFISVGLKRFMDPQKVTAFFNRYRRAGVIGATAIAVTTPFCSCGTMAVILGMMASTIPWAPIVAFMVASPLTSPEGLIYSAGLFGWPFAIAFFVSSILLGLLGGTLAGFFESRGWLKNQTRLAAPLSESSAAKHPEERAINAPASACGCPANAVPAQQSVLARDIRSRRPVLPTSPALELAVSGASAVSDAAQGCGCSAAPQQEAPAACGCGAERKESPAPQTAAAGVGILTKWPRAIIEFLQEAFQSGSRLLAMFIGFAFIGYFLNGLIPSEWVAAVFGKGNVYSVLLAATLGLPLYINAEGSLPLVRALIDGGMSQGAALAFLITGAGTSIGAISGAMTIARWRVIGLVIGSLWVGAVAIGMLYNAMLAAHLV